MNIGNFLTKTMPMTAALHAAAEGTVGAGSKSDQPANPEFVKWAKENIPPLPPFSLTPGFSPVPDAPKSNSPSPSGEGRGEGLSDSVPQSDARDHSLTIGIALVNLHERIVRFQREKFPNQPLLAKLTHLVREANELRDCNGMDKMEWADVFILLLGAADCEGLTLQHLILLAHRKMSVNEKREWHPPDADGVHHHKAPESGLPSQI